MDIIKENILDILINKGCKIDIFKGNFGLEKENVRVDNEANMSSTDHPSIFGEKLNNPIIQTDFAENQVEMITPVCNTIEEAYTKLKMINDEVYAGIGDELLWPQSSPPIINGDIPIAKYDDTEKGVAARDYREKLAVKYGKKKQLISGIHYNFSLEEQVIENIYNALMPGMGYSKFKDSLYLKICRNFMQYRWFLIYLLGASPAVHRSYLDSQTKDALDINIKDFYTVTNCISLRNSSMGYKNDKNYDIDFKSVKGYVDGINRLLEKAELINEKEFYNPVRLKSRNAKLNNLLEEGVNYIEIRLIDINPFSYVGITSDDLCLIHLFLLYCLLKEDITLNIEIAAVNQQRVASKGLDPNLTLLDLEHNEVQITKSAHKIINELNKIADITSCDKHCVHNIVDNAKIAFESPKNTRAYKIHEGIRAKGYVDYFLDIANDYKKGPKMSC